MMITDIRGAYGYRGGQTTKNTKNMNKISWRLILELVEAVVEAILRIFGGKSDKEQNKK